MEWFFDGLGTEIVSTIVGLIIGSLGGGTIGYKIGKIVTIKQMQTAGDNATQTQIRGIKNERK